MGTQQFCLKWNNHSSNMLNVFETLLTSEQLVDVTLACDGLSLKAHKMVLSACSPFFQSLFQENPCKHPIVILKDIRYTDLKAIIDFMYKGEVNVGQAHLSALLKTAETLKVKGLAEVSGEDGQSSSGSVVQQEVPVFPQAQHSSDVANIVQTIDNSIRPSSDSPTGRKRKRTKWKNRGQGNGNDSETDDQGPAAKNQEIVSADVIEDDSSSIGVVDGPSDTRNAKESRIIIEEATIVGDYVEPAALLEQNMTTDNVQPISSQLMLTNATSKDNEINVPENRSYDGTVATLTPETVDLIDRPEDVKPTALVSYEEPPMSPNATSSHHSQDDSNSMTMYMDPNSMPAIAGPSNYQQDKQPSASAGQAVIYVTEDIIPNELTITQITSNAVYESENQPTFIEITEDDESNPAMFASTSASGVDLPIIFPDLPMESVTDVDRLESLIVTPTNRRRVATRLSCILGHDLKDTVRRILTNLFSTDLAVQYCWLGAIGKSAFRDLHIRTVIYEALKMNSLTSSADEYEVDNVIKRWFKYASERAVGRPNRPKLRIRKQRLFTK